MKDFWMGFMGGVGIVMAIAGFSHQYLHSQCAKKHNVYQCKIKWEPVK